MNFNFIYKQNFIIILLQIFIFLVISENLTAQILMSSNGSYSQNFDTIPSGSVGNTYTWSDNDTIENWYASTTIGRVGDGSQNNGALYTYYTTGSTLDKALGSLNTNAFGHIAYGIKLKNTSGGTITDFSVGYTGEQYRKENNAAQDKISLYYKIYSTDTSAISNAVNTWNYVNTFNAPKFGATTASKLDGNNAANRQVFSPQPISGISIPNNSYIILKWVDSNITGSDHGVAIDDVNISWTVPTVTPTITLSSLTDNSYCINATTSFDASFSATGMSSPSYVLELSDNAGSFTSATSLATGTTSPLTGSIAANTYTAGTGYKVRIRETTTGTVSNTIDVAMLAAPTGSITDVNPIVCYGLPAKVKFTTTSTASPFSLMIGTTSPGTAYTGINNNDEITVESSATSAKTYSLYKITDANGCITE